MQPVFSGVTFQEQARFLVRAYILALSARVQEVCWYTFEDGEHARVWQEDAFGLFVHDEDWSDTRYPPAKPAYHALETLARTLGGLEFGQDLTSSLGLSGAGHAYRFDSVSQRVIVAWVTEPTGAATVSLSRLPDSVTVVGMLGSAEVVPTQGGTLVIELTPEPVYVVASQDGGVSDRRHGR